MTQFSAILNASSICQHCCSGCMLIILHGHPNPNDLKWLHYNFRSLNFCMTCLTQVMIWLAFFFFSFHYYYYCYFYYFYYYSNFNLHMSDLLPPLVSFKPRHLIVTPDGQALQYFIVSDTSFFISIQLTSWKQLWKLFLNETIILINDIPIYFSHQSFTNTTLMQQHQATHFLFFSL